MISFARTPSKKTFTTEALAKIQNFHQHIFDDILKVVKNAVYFSPQDSICPLMVVPIKKGKQLYRLCNLIKCMITMGN